MSELIQYFNKVSLRILLVDDKVGSENESLGCRSHFCGLDKQRLIDLPIKRCDPSKDCTSENCKLCTIKRLMDDGGGKDGKKGLFEKDGKGKHFYWNDKNIECYFCPTIVPDFIDVDKSLFPDFDDIRIKASNSSNPTESTDSQLVFQCTFDPIDSQATILKEEERFGNVQIVGVHDIRTALLLLSHYKFDMLFFDYLLDKKSEDSDMRENSRQFFDFLTCKFGDKAKVEKNEVRRNKYLALERLRLAVLDNRGPVDKFWIMPITGFNQTFIQDIYSNKISLIDYRWNISNGADPITTPWQFLYHLNKFIELQLKSCVYQMDKLLRFVRYTCEDLHELENKGGTLGFYDFQSFMGAEYANFMRRYGNRHLIQRDAILVKVNVDNKDLIANKSVFASYVWKKVYSEPKYRDSIELNRLIQRFLYHTSIMHNDRLGQQRLEETFGQLCFFIETNKRVRDCVTNLENGLSDGFDFHEGLLYLRGVLDRLTTHSK